MATWDRYKSNTTGLEIIAQKGVNFTPRFYCDDTSGSVYITKAPVAILKLTPTVQFVNTNIAWDVSQSVSATGTIDTFDLTFGGGGATDLTGQDWSVDAKTGNVQYTSTGTYTVTLYVTDTGSNRSAAARQTVNVIDLASVISKVYMSTSDLGVFTYVPGGTPVTANTGLSGDDLAIWSGKLNPHYSQLPITQQHYWIANDNGIAYSVDGCSTWTKITRATLGDPTNTARDATPPTTDDLYEVAIEFDPQNPLRVYVLRVTDDTLARTWLYWSDDYGVTWSSFGLLDNDLVGATIKAINHDSSTTIGDFYNSIIDFHGMGTITAGAALDGTTYGLNLNYDTGTNDGWFVETFTAHTGGSVYMEFRIDWSDITFVGAATLAFEVQLRNSSDQRMFRMVFNRGSTNSFVNISIDYHSDSGGSTFFAIVSDLSMTSELLIGLKMVRESVDTAADGIIELFVDNIYQAGITNADNIVRWTNIDRVRLYAQNSDADITGNLHYDEFMLSVLAGRTSFIEGYGWPNDLMRTSSSGDFLFNCLTDYDTDYQVIFKTARPTSTTPTTTIAYETTIDEFASVEKTGDLDTMIFYGDLGGSEYVVKYTISTGATIEIGNSKAIHILRVNPSDENHIIAYDDNTPVLEETTDGGTVWTALSGPVSLVEAYAMAIVFLGNYFPWQMFMVGIEANPFPSHLEYTPNEYANARDDTSAALALSDSIVSVDIGGI